MVNNNFFLYSGKILAESVRDVLFFPIWWYTRGLLELLEKLMQMVIDRERSLALSVWIKNILKPMYGQYDWQGVMISIFMRIVQIIFRTFVLLIWVLIAFLIFMAWNILPIFTIYEIVFQCLK